MRVLLIKAATILFGLFIFFSARAEADPIIYLEWVEDPTTSMIVNWIGETGSNRSFEYRERNSNNSWNTLQATAMTLPNTSLRRFQGRINGLEPGTSYEFRISTISGTRYFRTAPASIEEPIRFLVGGDLFETRVTGARFEELKQVFEDVTGLAATYNPHFLVVGGDYVHNPDDYPDVEEWFYLLSTFTERLVTTEGSYQVPIIGTLGNHEVPNAFGDRPEDAIYFHGFFSYPQEQWSSKRSYGVLDFADYLSIITLDSNHTHSIRSQSSWLNTTLSQRSNVPHVYPVYHISAWPAFRSFRGILNDEMRDEWHPIFRNNGVRMVFEHHDHIYKRTFPFLCTPPITGAFRCEVSNNDGVITLGGGSWGSGIRNTHPDFQSGGQHTDIHQVIEEQNNFVVMEISNKKRSMQAISLNSGIIDTFEEVFFLPPPVVLEPQAVSSNSFVAVWEPVNEADHYRLDVSTDSNFSTFVDGFNDMRIEVDEVTEFEVDGLIPGQVYFYRMRARTPPTTSDNSNVVQVKTVGVDAELSSLIASADEGEANGVDTVKITALARDENGNLLQNAPVEIFAVEGTLNTEESTSNTNSDGEAYFEVRNTISEVVTYEVVAGGTTINQMVTVTFRPEAPVALNASNVGTSSFTANWEMVTSAESYFLDVANDSTFSQFLDGFENINTGNVTSFDITGLNPGNRYYYRVRSGAGEIRGIASRTVVTTTFPMTPTSNAPLIVNATWFEASWDAAEGAESYLIDVSQDEDFNSYVGTFEALDVGSNTEFRILGLDPGTTYFYRVRAVNDIRVTEPSEIITVTTLIISSENSELISDQRRILANGIQQNEIVVILRGENNVLLEDVEVDLLPQNGNSSIEIIQPVTDDEGRAIFSVTNTFPEEITYEAFFRDLKIGEITLEFIQDDGVLKLGKNYPNPFRDSTIIPVNVPKEMHVKVDIYNSAGNYVYTIHDGELSKGFYEFKFGGNLLASGVYFYRLLADGQIITESMLIIR